MEPYDKGPGLLLATVVPLIILTGMICGILTGFLLCLFRIRVPPYAAPTEGEPSAPELASPGLRDALLAERQTRGWGAAIGLAPDGEQYTAIEQNGQITVFTESESEPSLVEPPGLRWRSGFVPPLHWVSWSAFLRARRT